MIETAVTIDADVEAAVRAKIAREAHDDLCQLLFVMKLKLDSLRRSSEDPKLGEIDELLRESVASARSLLEVPRPQVQPFGCELASVIRQIEKRFGIEVETDLAHGIAFDSDSVSAAVVRTVREVLTNMAKHSSTRRARVSIGCDSGGGEVIVTVAGPGWRSISDGPRKPDDARAGFGLESIRLDIQEIGGRVWIGSDDETGAAAIVHVPITRCDCRSSDFNSSRSTVSKAFSAKGDA